MPNLDIGDDSMKVAFGKCTLYRQQTKAEELLSTIVVMKTRCQNLVGKWKLDFALKFTD